MKIFLAILMLILGQRCFARPFNDVDLLRLGVLLADSARIGTIEGVTELGPSDPTAYFSVRFKTSEGIVDSLSMDQSFGEKYRVDGTKRLFLTRDWTSAAGIEKRFLLRFPWGGVHDATGIADSDVQPIGDVAKTTSLSYLRSTACDENYKRLIDSLVGRRQQRVIETLYSKRPVTSTQFVCLVEALGALQPLKVKEIRVPWQSWEGTYHHNYENLGQLVALLLPHLADYGLIADMDTPTEKLRLAWGYWGAVEFDFVKESAAAVVSPKF